ncbi:MAG TPA: hypothetical protein VFF14_11080 [Candidatus Deferrimicrobium sp.]|nr:hypothetical protein [Candidatus Deferrimicrobium sp.]
MEFVLRTALTLVVFSLGLLVFLQGRKGMVAAALILTTIAELKDLTIIIPGLFGLIALISVISEGKIQAWVHDQSKGALFPGLAGSLVILLFYGIFFGPLSSLLLWLITSGLELFPQLRVRVGKLRIWGNSIYRAGLTLCTLVVGLYVTNR